MKQTGNPLLLAVLCFSAVAFNTQAAGLQSKQVPAGAKWFLHLDLEAFKATQMGKFALEQLTAFGPQIDAVSALMQSDLRKDLSGITVFGANDVDEPEMAVVLIHGQFKPAHVLTLLKANPTFRSEKVGDRELLTWTDKKNSESKTQFGSIVNENLLLVGTQQKFVVQALKVLDGQSPALDPKKLADLQIEKGAYLTGGLFSLAALPVPPEAKVLENVKSLALALGENGTKLEANLRLNASNEEAATQVQQLLQGLIALGQVTLDNIDDPKAKQSAELILKNIQANRTKEWVNISIALPIDMLIQQSRAAMDKLGLPKPKPAPSKE